MIGARGESSENVNFPIAYRRCDVIFAVNTQLEISGLTNAFK